MRRRAVLSVRANPACPDQAAAEKAVNEVWESCFNDTRPFDEVRREAFMMQDGVVAAILLTSDARFTEPCVEMAIHQVYRCRWRDVLGRVAVRRPVDLFPGHVP